MTLDVSHFVLDRLGHALGQAERSLRVWSPQAGPQQKLIESDDVFEVLLGGARGGGKTDAMFGDWLLHHARYGGAARGMFVRRVAKDLEGLLPRAKELFEADGGKWVGGAASEFRWPDGSTLKFRHVKTVDDAEKYRGWSLTRIYAEELTEWPDEEPLRRLKATLRSAAGVQVGFRATTNPGGPGHQWVKLRYGCNPKEIIDQVDPETELPRRFIPAQLKHNPALVENDPKYERRIQASGPPYLVRAWLKGDWDIVPGSFFEGLIDRDVHGLDVFEPPESWRRFIALDWGYAKPASFGMWAVSDGSPVPELGKRVFPRGSMVRYREWYTVQMQGGIPVPNKGLKLSSYQLGVEGAKLCQGVEWDGNVAGLDIFAGPEDERIVDEMERGAASVGGFSFDFEEAETKRPAGWQRVIEMLRAAAEERPEEPGLWVAERTCPHWWRTVPTLPVDPKRGDDVDTDAEDHAGDETRYAVMAEAAAPGSTGQPW